MYRGKDSKCNRTTRRARLATRLFFKPTSAFVVLVCSVVIFHVSVTRAQNPPAEQSTSKPSVFRVKYVSDGSLYIDGGGNANLQEAMKLSLVNAPPDAWFPMPYGSGVTSTWRSSKSFPWRLFFGLRNREHQWRGQGRADGLSHARYRGRTPVRSWRPLKKRSYPIIMTFTYGDPLEEEVRTAQEQKQFQESPVGRVRAGSALTTAGSTNPAGSIKQVGLSIQSDISNIGGPYWNFKGYWRGNMNLSSAPGLGASTTTLTDLINRTYHLGFTYQSPYSPLTIGIGRLFLPWAPSLSTIDGGYLRKKNHPDRDPWVSQDPRRIRPLGATIRTSGLPELS